jgi:hypothetical protein
MDAERKTRKLHFGTIAYSNERKALCKSEFLLINILEYVRRMTGDDIEYIKLNEIFNDCIRIHDDGRYVNVANRVEKKRARNDAEDDQRKAKNPKFHVNLDPRDDDPQLPLVSSSFSRVMASLVARGMIHKNASTQKWSIC